MLTEFFLAVEDVGAAGTRLNQLLAERRGSDHRFRLRTHDLCQDIVGFSGLFIKSHMDATMWMTDLAYEANHRSGGIAEDSDIFEASMAGRALSGEQAARLAVRLAEAEKFFERSRRRESSRAGTWEQDAGRQLTAAYKAYFFFIRALQDACYKQLLTLAKQPAGDQSSVMDAVNNSKNLFHATVAGILGYTDWIADFREKRNAVKRGANFSLWGPQWDVGIGYVKTTAEGGIVVDVSQQAFRIGDLIQAFRQSKALMEAVEGYAKENPAP
ncbi:MAG: hypothetical protein HYX47_02930 [Burkholderiales bacterium]|nr:hypothetical protein [Burkholderiales bacterium]